MASITPIGVGTGGQSTSQPSGANFFDYLQLGVGAVGPGLVAGLSGQGQTIAGAAVNSLFASSGALGSGGLYGGTGTSTGTSYLSGGYAGTGTSTSGSGDLENMLSESAMSQAYLIQIQSQLGQQQTMFTSLSNAINMKDNMARSTIQNFKV